jgi:hypothetical protein
MDRVRAWTWLVVATLVGCAPSPSSSSDGGSTGPGPAPGSTSIVVDDSSADDGMTSSLPPDPTTGGASTGGPSPTGSDSSGGACVPGPIDCGGIIWGCGDTLDNDGDGLVDLDDPECVTPCDDREDTFDTGLPGDNFDCTLDCAFDGNSGQGDDLCMHRLACDPADPGADFGCAYNPGPGCPRMLPAPQVPECPAFCEPRTPPGCDCFGCCEVSTPSGPITIYVGEQSNCSLADPTACSSCTLQIEECGTPCDPAACMQCFGQTGPPPGCDTVGCPYGEPCEDECDCPDDAHCMLGCCYPDPPG